MNNKKSINIAVVIIVFFLLQILYTRQAVAFGVSPAAISEKKLLPGSDNNYMVSLIRSPAEKEEIALQLRIHGRGADYIKVPAEIIMASATETKLSFTIAVPDYAAGDYQAMIDIYPKPNSHKPDQIAVLAGVSIPVDFYVQNSGNVKADLADLQFAGESNQSIQLKVTNTGSVEMSVNKVKAEIQSLDGEIIANGEYYNKQEIINLIPQQNKDLLLAFENAIMPGKYQAIITLLSDSDEEIAVFKEELVKAENKTGIFNTDNAISSSKHISFFEKDFVLLFYSLIVFVFLVLVILMIKYYLSHNKKIKK